MEMEEIFQPFGEAVEVPMLVRDPSGKWSGFLWDALADALGQMNAVQRKDFLDRLYLVSVVMPLTSSRNANAN